MTTEELLKSINEAKAKQQNEFIDRIYDEIDHLCEKANKKDYVPTQHEKETFEKITSIILNMKSWF